jgi:hypothetical protein
VAAVTTVTALTALAALPFVIAVRPDAEDLLNVGHV